MDDKRPGYFTIKNWVKYQHYKDRSPPWIKLHATIFEDYEFDCLHDASKLHLILIWVLASKLGEKNPRIPNDPEWIRKKIHLKNKPDLKPLFKYGFLVSDSEVLAPCLQDARTEGEGEGEGEAETEGEGEGFSPDYFFEEDWARYPRKAGNKKAALRHYKKSVKSHEKRKLFLKKMDAYVAANTDNAFRLYASSFFNQWEGLEVAEPEEQMSENERINRELIEEYANEKANKS